LTTAPIAIIQGQMDKVAYPMNSINLYEKLKHKIRNFGGILKCGIMHFYKNNIQKLNKESYLGFKKGDDLISSNDFLVGFFYK
jgi:PhoPQ-activated pathogenicity-related protein